MPRIFLSAGEASGEHYGASLIPAIRQLVPDAEFFGLGGQRMEALGFRRIVRAEDVAVMGITEVILHMPRIYGEYRKLKASILRERPDLAILIDFPDVNLSLARHLKRAGVPVLYFVSPQLWAWKKYRIRDVQRYVDRMLVIFPFEEQFYLNRKVQADLRRPSAGRSAASGRSAATPSLAKIVSTRPNSGSACYPAAARKKFASICPKWSKPPKPCSTGTSTNFCSRSPRR